MSWMVDGLPLHPLLVHAVVVGIPVTGLLAIAAAWGARVRDWLGVILPVIATASAAAALLAKEAGEALAERVARTPAVAAHTDIADFAVVGAALLMFVCWVQWGWDQFAVRVHPGRTAARVTGPRTARGVAIAISIAQTVIAVFAIVAVVIVGDTGARAVWVG